MVPDCMKLTYEWIINDMRVWTCIQNHTMVAPLWNYEYASEIWNPHQGKQNSI